MRTVLAAVLAALLSACLSVGYGRTRRDTELPLARTAELVPGQTELGACLAAFGAPHWVLEQASTDGSGAVLLWDWLDEDDLGLSLSVPLGEQGSMNFDYRQLDARTRGLVLFFDGRWVLTDWRSGRLVEIARDVRPRPAFLEEDA